MKIYDYQRIARALDLEFNGGRRDRENGVGFALFVFPFGEFEESRVDYVSNADRESMIAAVREWLERAEGSSVKTGTTH